MIGLPIAHLLRDLTSGVLDINISICLFSNS